MIATASCLIFSSSVSDFSTSYCYLLLGGIKRRVIYLITLLFHLLSKEKSLSEREELTSKLDRETSFLLVIHFTLP